MKSTSKILLVILILANTLFLAGCWNYREIDTLRFVAGIAIDKGESGDQYLLTVETADIKNGGEAIMNSNTITVAGDTLLDAKKNMDSISGKKLYFAHARVAVLSQAVAKEGAVKVIDWLARNAELREDIEVLVSQASTAQEILETGSKTDQIISFELDKVMKNQKTIANAPEKELWNLINDLGGSGISAVLPLVSLKKVNSRTLPSVTGTAVFKKDKLVGFLNDNDTRDLLFIQNKVDGGLLVQNGEGDNAGSKVSLKILDTRTKLKPVEKDGNVEISIDIKTTVAIDEIEGTENYIDEPGRLRLEKSAEESMKKSIENLVQEVQMKYNCDIFGFGAKVKTDMPGTWKEIETLWGDKFKDLKVSVHPELTIKNSAAFSHPLRIGD
ncbi:Ger(x)C family spore germination protein [Desulfosporosinus meridiei]|uniref:Germination protein, Ger(X)C family n=1 Tax=Desulfosporosinus meridiei (strain ATCC BAA-275 / DSM 13257 / KCTC 12902 / NCIMB 13706 / S10) TaxID=768704 RepID=J7IZ29_DESMD|nr:Ger(x)C family spore germination protein [Desulfosporosinus meridiei]AFQ44303.1 germination protein, Ger(X)C family [Desulfosporosinus meridiei DSM 13257]